MRRTWQKYSRTLQALNHSLTCASSTQSPTLQALPHSPLASLQAPCQYLQQCAVQRVDARGRQGWGRGDWRGHRCRWLLWVGGMEDHRMEVGS